MKRMLGEYSNPKLLTFLVLGLTACGTCGDPRDELVTHLDLQEHVHLADVWQDGLHIDFGTPAQAKYTVGDWRTGFGRRGREGATTFASVGRRGRVYLPLRQQADHHVRLQLRRRGTGALTPYFNNEELKSLFFDGDGFQAVDFVLPAEHVKVGENYLHLVFGGTTSIAGEDVSVDLASLHVRPGSSAGTSATAPGYDALTRTVELDGEERESLVLRGALEWNLQVPESGKLTFEAGAMGDGSGTATVTLQSDGAAAEALAELELEGEWSSHTLDIAAHAGEVVRLRFEAPDGAEVALSQPQIATPAVEQPQVDPAKHVIVVLVDTLRADKLQAYNSSSRVKTPIFDGLVEESVLFERAQSPENWTKPSVASVLTGLDPLDHGARTQEAVLSESAWMLSEHFQKAGHKTAAFIGNGYVSGRFGFNQGWDKYRNLLREQQGTDARDIFKHASDWAAEHKDEPFFLYVHTIDPHVPYDPPDAYLSMYDSRSDYDGQVRARMTADLLEGAKKNPPKVTFSESDVRRLLALHDGEISQHDAELGVFIERLKELGVWEDSVFVFVSDHGEEFNDHGSWGHGHTIFQELLHVPLLVRRNGFAARRVATPVSTMDVAPTVVELAGLEPLPNIAARSLSPLMHGGTRPGQAVPSSYFREERRVMVSRDYKFIVRGNLTASLFNLAADPGEENQLPLSAFPIAVRHLRTLHGQYLGATDRGNWLSAHQEAGQNLAPGEVRMDDELQDQLRQLGYHVD